MFSYDALANPIPIPDVKPNNIFLNWFVDSRDRFHLQKVVLGDMDCALKLEGEKLLNSRIGNVMWRSPEGQLGKGVGKPSEVFSLALLVGPMLNLARKKLLTRLFSASTSLQECSLST